MFLPGDMIPLSWKLRVPSGHLGLLNRPLCLNQQAKKEVTVLGGVIDLDQQGELGWLFHTVGEEEYVWNTGNPLKYLLVLMIKTNGNYNNSNPKLTIQNPQEGMFGDPTR